jgi:tetratricopeptide (TPR) repeat protein
MSAKQLPRAKKNPFNRLINSTKNICAAAVKKGVKLGAKLSGSEPAKEYFTVEDYMDWIVTRTAQVTDALDATKDLAQKTQYEIELSALQNLQKEPTVAYEARKSKLVKYAEEIKRLAKDSDVQSIAPIWRALAMDNTEPAESFLHQLSRESGPKAGAAAFLLGQISEGRFDFGQALKFYRKAYLNGPKNKSYMEANAHMAFLLEFFDEAESLLQRTVEILGHARRRNPGKLFNAITNLAHIFEMRGDLESALMHHQRALEVREKALGPEHPELAGALNNMAALCEMRGHVEEAYEYSTRAVNIYQTSLGPDSPKVAAALSNLADICLKKNSRQEAKQKYEQGLAIALKSGGIDSPLYVKIKSNLDGLTECA